MTESWSWKKMLDGVLCPCFVLGVLWFHANNGKELSAIICTKCLIPNKTVFFGKQFLALFSWHCRRGIFRHKTQCFCIARLIVSSCLSAERLVFEAFLIRCQRRVLLRGAITCPCNVVHVYVVCRVCVCVCVRHSCGLWYMRCCVRVCKSKVAKTLCSAMQMVCPLKEACVDCKKHVVQTVLVLCCF